MPQPIALCLEDIDAVSEDARFLRCVALGGRQPGLRIGADATVSWQPVQPPSGRAADDAPGQRRSTMEVPVELWVSADDQLILFRPTDAVPIAVDRMGRRLEVPYDKPVVLLDGDRLETAGRRLRIHVHGATTQAHAPQPLAARSRAAQRLAAAVVVMGAAVASCEVRDNPPEPPLDTSRAPTAAVPTGPPDAGDDNEAAAPNDSGAHADGGASSGTTATPSGPAPGPSATPAASASAPRPQPAAKPPGTVPKPKPIEVRDMPPYM